MPDKPETWAWLAAWLEHQWPALYASALAFWIAALRIVYSGGKLRRVAMEAPLCGVVVLAVSNGLQLLGIPMDTAPFWGGVIALLGIESTRAAARQFFKRQVDLL
jgi:lambda family phage holin